MVYQGSKNKLAKHLKPIIESYLFIKENRMKKERREIKIRDLIKGYKNGGETNGVVAFDGNLQVRPAYQREFIYKLEQQQAVIETILEDCPLNLLHWAKNGDRFEVLDGQQRIISICSFIQGDYAYIYQNEKNPTPKYWSQLTPEEQEQILNYELDVYIFNGNEAEKLKWFAKINTAGEPLNQQELLNAAYTGTFINEAKKFFSKTNGPAYRLAKNVIKGTPNRQEILELALKWMVQKENLNSIAEYLAINKDNSADVIINEFSNVIEWVNNTFTNQSASRQSALKKLSSKWYRYYSQYKDKKLNAQQIEQDLTALWKDPEIENKAGIYEYILTFDIKYLSLRVFSEGDKQSKYQEQNGICALCNKLFDYQEMAGDHIIPWSQGGKTVYNNLQMLCRRCNASKGNR